ESRRRRAPRSGAGRARRRKRLRLALLGRPRREILEPVIERLERRERSDAVLPGSGPVAAGPELRRLRAAGVGAGLRDGGGAARVRGGRGSTCRGALRSQRIRAERRQALLERPKLGLGTSTPLRARGLCPAERLRLVLKPVDVPGDGVRRSGSTAEDECQRG